MDWTRGSTLGHGSTATVSSAVSLRTGETFAVKSSELSQSEILQREQIILSSISSPHIVSYLGCDITKEQDKLMYNLFLEYMPWGTLSDAISANGCQLDESMIGFYTWQIVQGLHYLHSIGLAHCDIKSTNVLIGPSGAKIADFGCAKWVDQIEPVRSPIGGTPMLMAPEVARGEEQGCAGDMWALGCTLIEMASGRPPWPDSNDMVSVIYRIGYSGEVPEFPSALSEEAKDFLYKCLKREPRQRWTASQLLKHPFLLQHQKILSCNKSKQFHESKNYSPTSIVDQRFWNSLNDRSEDENFSDHQNSSSERIKRLSMVTSSPDWDSNDQNWITIRESSTSDVDVITEEDVEEKLGMFIDAGKNKESYVGRGEIMLDLLDGKNVIRSKCMGDGSLVQGSNFRDQIDISLNSCRLNLSIQVQNCIYF